MEIRSEINRNTKHSLLDYPKEVGYLDHCRRIGLALLVAAATTMTTVGNAQRHSQPSTSFLPQEQTLIKTIQTPQTEPESSPQRVLRHAVFFSFKESSSEADVQEVVDAFAALPKKIKAIIQFQSGTNNSPEGLGDGFTHCFLLTFQDEAGRSSYLPHPAHTGEFASTLRPHLKDVFVIDYWGEKTDKPPERALKHAVFFKFKDNADPAAIKRVEDAFAALPTRIDTIKSFEWGTNNSPEKHDDGFTHCFMVTFDSEEGRKQYLPHPDHLEFVEILKPVLDKVRVLDFWEDGYQGKP